MRVGSERGPRLGVAQMPMAWSLEENLACILSLMALAAERGVEACLFPELALSGFHRRIGDQVEPARMATALQSLQAACAEHGMALSLGLPWVQGAQRFNRQLFMDAAGATVGCVDKHGLTESESLFFARGPERRAQFDWAGCRCSAVLCREVDDAELLLSQLRGADLLLWPSYISWPPQGPGPDYGPAAAALARQCGAWLLHCNWPQGLNEPAARGFGGSMLFDPRGAPRLQLPLDQPGLAVFDLHAPVLNWTAA